MAESLANRAAEALRPVETAGLKALLEARTVDETALERSAQLTNCDPLESQQKLPWVNTYLLNILRDEEER